MDMEPPQTRLDPLDEQLLRLRSQMTPGQRIYSMLQTRALLVGMKRGRLRRQYPDLTERELNLKLLEEIDHAKQIRRRP